MDNSNASSGSNARAGPSAAANDEERPIVYRGVTLGYAKRPVLRSTDAGYKGLLSDFHKGRPMKRQIADIQRRRVRAVTAISNLLNQETQ
ncbi:hypothetical protein BCON_0268g00050 [Botryotinia convoluta]|uniref:Uncharacterized protein n=1 Tax=Botryotinia convoluta TaxID=54673 RepID=A0A4Z1HS13_9HELO|nr:hypothetical protein BCON_0268g00050 [Botryotinia convoluta]